MQAPIFLEKQKNKIICPQLNNIPAQIIRETAVVSFLNCCVTFSAFWRFYINLVGRFESLGAKLEGSEKIFLGNNFLFQDTLV